MPELYLLCLLVTVLVRLDRSGDCKSYVPYLSLYTRSEEMISPCRVSAVPVLFVLFMLFDRDGDYIQYKSYNAPFQIWFVHLRFDRNGEHKFVGGRHRVVTAVRIRTAS